MPFAQIQENRLYYEDTGGNGPVVLLSHGFLLDHTMWTPQVEALRARYRCITWDERSHGMSEVHGPFTHWDAARDALDRLGIRRGAAIGERHDLGDDGGCGLDGLLGALEDHVVATQRDVRIEVALDLAQRRVARARECGRRLVADVELSALDATVHCHPISVAVGGAPLDGASTPGRHSPAPRVRGRFASPTG